MQDNPCETININVFSTYKTSYAARVHVCKRFVLISANKHAYSTNIMGTPKCICVMIIQSFNTMYNTGQTEEIFQLFTHMDNNTAQRNLEALHDVKTEFVTVSFGNELGFNGLVNPLFRKQIV